MKVNSVGHTEKHKYDFHDHSQRLQVIFDVHPKEFIGIKLQQTVFLTGLDKYIGSLHCTKKALDKGLVPLIHDNGYNIRVHSSIIAHDFSFLFSPQNIHESKELFNLLFLISPL